MDKRYQASGIDPRTRRFGEQVLSGLRARFDAIDEHAEYNQLKVLQAMRECQVSEACLLGTTGYGYDDIGRDRLEEVYAKVFCTEDALVRPLIASGTHALHVALSGNLRPGDLLLSPVGKPYDTLEEVIGIRPSCGSLAEYGVRYEQVDLLSDGSFDFEGIGKVMREKKPRMVTIQRSRGYQTRPSLSVARIGELIRFIRSIDLAVICLVDNCYGEFVEREEPSEVGADLLVGSLIKNPGGGLAPMGGYIAGRRDLVYNAAVRLTSPGLGKEVGATLSNLRAFYQGFFLAPTVVASAVKAAIFASAIYEALGFAVYPKAGEERTDIIQAITFGAGDALLAFCRGIQAASPVDAHVRPDAAPMPGYDSEVVMAAGTFIQGSSIELSADGPMRPDYSVFMQGGLTFTHAKYGVLMSLQSLIDEGVLGYESFDAATIQGGQ